jgi:hypothetical protein
MVLRRIAWFLRNHFKKGTVPRKCMGTVPFLKWFLKIGNTAPTGYGERMA